MSGGPKGAQRPLGRPLDGGVRPHPARPDGGGPLVLLVDLRFAHGEELPDAMDGQHFQSPVNLMYVWV